MRRWTPRSARERALRPPQRARPPVERRHARAPLRAGAPARAGAARAALAAGRWRGAVGGLLVAPRSPPLPQARVPDDGGGARRGGRARAGGGRRDRPWAGG